MNSDYVRMENLDTVFSIPGATVEVYKKGEFYCPFYKKNIRGKDYYDCPETSCLTEESVNRVKESAMAVIERTEKNG